MSSLELFHSVPAQISAVALVVHGLNYRPDRMQPVVDCLNHAGVDCLLLSLHGHGDNYVKLPGLDAVESRLHAYRCVTTDLWLDELCAAYDIARSRADYFQVPMLYCGYSLGGMLGCLSLVEKNQVNFDGLLLFSPAIALDRYSLPMVLSNWLPNLIVPSVSPTYYRANRGTPAAAYHALFEGIARIYAGDMQRMNVSTLIFMDERDELVSYRGVNSLAENLSSWRMFTVRKSPPAEGNVYHHLIIGNPAVGTAMWSRITDQITRFVHRTARKDIPVSREHPLKR